MYPGGGEYILVHPFSIKYFDLDFLRCFFVNLYVSKLFVKWNRLPDNSRTGQLVVRPLPSCFSTCISTQSNTKRRSVNTSLNLTLWDTY